MSMPWFKHYNNASTALSIQKMMLNLGVIGYAYYFLLLELLCSKFDGSNCVIDLTLSEVAVKLRIKSGRVEVILKSFSESNLVSSESLGLIIRITAPILLELKSKDFKRARQERVSEADSTLLRKRLKKEIKKEIKIKNNTLVDLATDEKVLNSDIQNLSLIMPRNAETFIPDLNLIYAEFPRKEGKKAGLERLRKVIKSQEIFDQVLMAVRNYKIRTIGQDQKFIKQFSSFVSVWEDYLVIEEKDKMQEAKEAMQKRFDSNPFRSGGLNVI